MIPLIGSACQGSLGVSQLPRTWWKAVTRAVGLLDEAYPDDSGGLDTWCLQAVGLDVDETYAYLRAELPDYLAFEKWVLQKKAGALPAAPIARYNEIVQYRRHIRPHKITETYADIGFDPEVDTYTSALLLNTLQDWHLFHARDLGAADAPPAGLPPLVSSLDVGPLGVLQLARTWQKSLLDAEGLLHPDYPAFSSGLDQGVLDALGLDRDAVRAYLYDERPTYMDLENWISQQVGEPDRVRVDAFHARLLEREHPQAKREGIHALTGCDPALKKGVLLNHLEDWRYAYDVAIAPHTS